MGAAGAQRVRFLPEVLKVILRVMVAGALMERLLWAGHSSGPITQKILNSDKPERLSCAQGQGWSRVGPVQWEQGSDDSSRQEGRHA